MYKYDKYNKYNSKPNDNFKINNNSKLHNSTGNFFVKRTKKNEIYLGNLDKKTKQRKKKEFSKTNKSILSYNCKKVVNFN